MKRITLILALCFAGVAAQAAGPRGGLPVRLFGGEMHNSNASVKASLEASFTLARTLGFNSVLAPVSWEQIEPEEGSFDFTTVQDIISAAEKYDLLVGILWFGSWKNGESSYPPLWVKQNVKKYFRCVEADGLNSMTLSPFCTAAMQADATAFARLMAYIRDHDPSRRICVVQVENECGAFMERDLCPQGVKAWKKGGWDKLSDPLTPQRFMAEAFARYVDAVAAAGKKEHNLPMFTNAWLAGENAPYKHYPNGGPRVAVLDVWKRIATHLDWLSPDIYSAPFASLCATYSEGQPLFIPETSREIGRYYYAFGEKKAAGVFSFGFEESYDDPYYTIECRTFSELLPYLEQDLPSRGFYRDAKVDKNDATVQLKLGKYTFDVHYIDGEKKAHGMILQTGEDEYLVAGVGAWISFSSDPDQTSKIAWCEELRGDTVYQVLNGDETGHHNMLYLRGRLHLDDYTAPDGTVIPAPAYDLSHQRRFWESAQARFKTSGIYRIRLYSYPAKP